MSTRYLIRIVSGRKAGYFFQELGEGTTPDINDAHRYTAEELEDAYDWVMAPTTPYVKQRYRIRQVD